MGQTESGVAASAAQLEARYFRQKVKLGQGSFGTVWRAVDRESGETVAIKELVTANFLSRGVSKGDVLREVELMRACRHQNVTQLLGFFEDKASLYLALEYCDGGDFGDKIRQLGSGVTEPEAAAWMRQMCDAVAALHSQGVVHRDIKPENFMVHGKTQLKLADFGLAVRLAPGELLTQVSGTPAFLAPEQHPFALKTFGYGLPVDMWALGVSMYMLIFGGKHPFTREDGSFDDMRMLKAELDFKDKKSAPGFLGLEGPGGMGLRFSEAARSLCRRLLTVEAARRLPAREATNDPWLHDEWRSSSSRGSSSRASSSRPSTPPMTPPMTPPFPSPGREQPRPAAVGSRRPSISKVAEEPARRGSVSRPQQAMKLPTPSRGRALPGVFHI